MNPARPALVALTGVRFLAAMLVVFPLCTAGHAGFAGEHGAERISRRRPVLRVLGIPARVQLPRPGGAPAPVVAGSFCVNLSRLPAGFPADRPRRDFPMPGQSIPTSGGRVSRRDVAAGLDPGLESVGNGRGWSLSNEASFTSCSQWYCRSSSPSRRVLGG